MNNKMNNKVCKNCNSDINHETTIIIDNDNLCIDCAANILNHDTIENIIIQDDIIELIGKDLSPNDLISLKRTLKGFSTHMDIVILNSIQKYKESMLDQNIRGPLNGTIAQFHNFGGDDNQSFILENIEMTDNIEENLEFFNTFSQNIMSEYLDGQYDFFDSDGIDYETFAELLYAEQGIEHQETESIIDFLKTNKGSINPETIIDIKQIIINNLIIHFEPENNDFYMYKVTKEIENNNNCLVGDIFYAEYYKTSRPYYGLGIVGWDFENNKKIPIIDSEGQFVLSEYIFNKLKENNVKYEIANFEVKSLLFEEFEDNIWVLPKIYQTINT